jgi:hypothetical protein
MIVSTRSFVRAGIGAGLTLALVVPATGVANAATAASPHAAAATVSSTTKHDALVALRAAIAKADADHKAAVTAAQAAFLADPVVVAAKAQRLSIVTTATDPALILAANQAYADSVSGAAETRAAAIDSARTARFAAIDAAYAAYDLIVNPPNAIARNAYRAAMRSANYELRTHVNAAHKTFRVSTAPAHAQLRASINAAIAQYKVDGNVKALTAALTAAHSAFAKDAVVVTARHTRAVAVHNAWTSYAADVRAARVAFHKATGHWPHGQKIVVPKV